MRTDPWRPDAQAVAVAQDRVQKLHFGRCAVACAPYAVVESTQADVAHVDTALFPAILKTARSGYDGRANCLASAQALQATWTELGQSALRTGATTGLGAGAVGDFSAGATVRWCTTRPNAMCTAAAFWP